MLPDPCTGVPRKPGMTRDDLFNVNAGGQSENWQTRSLGHGSS